MPLSRRVAHPHGMENPSAPFIGLPICTTPRTVPAVASTMFSLLQCTQLNQTDAAPSTTLRRASQPPFASLTAVAFLDRSKTRGWWAWPLFCWTRRPWWAICKSASEVCKRFDMCVTHHCLQKITRVVGVEMFLLDAQTLAGDLQKRFAASATITELSGEKNKGHYEIVLQVIEPVVERSRKSCPPPWPGALATRATSRTCSRRVGRHQNRAVAEYSILMLKLHCLRRCHQLVLIDGLSAVQHR